MAEIGLKRGGWADAVLAAVRLTEDAPAGVRMSQFNTFASEAGQVLGLRASRSDVTERMIRHVRWLRHCRGRGRRLNGSDVRGPLDLVLDQVRYCAPAVRDAFWPATGGRHRWDCHVAVWNGRPLAVLKRNRKRDGPAGSGLVEAYQERPSGQEWFHAFDATDLRRRVAESGSLRGLAAAGTPPAAFLFRDALMEEGLDSLVDWCDAPATAAARWERAKATLAAAEALMDWKVE